MQLLPLQRGWVRHDGDPPALIAYEEAAGRFPYWWRLRRGRDSGGEALRGPSIRMQLVAHAVMNAVSTLRPKLDGSRPQ